MQQECSQQAASGGIERSPCFAYSASNSADISASIPSLSQCLRWSNAKQPNRPGCVRLATSLAQWWKLRKLTGPGSVLLENRADRIGKRPRVYISGYHHLSCPDGRPLFTLPDCGRIAIRSEPAPILPARLWHIVDFPANLPKPRLSQLAACSFLSTGSRKRLHRLSTRLYSLPLFAIAAQVRLNVCYASMSDFSSS
jgi:hypothetical protein